MNVNSTARIKRQRRAVAAISVLVASALVTILFSIVARTLLLERQLLRGTEDRLQAEYLAESALERAAARLATDSTYRGETWRLDAETLKSRAAAAVVIRVEPPAGSTDGRRIRVAAEFPETGIHRARCTKEIILSQPGAGP